MPKDCPKAMQEPGLTAGQGFSEALPAWTGCWYPGQKPRYQCGVPSVVWKQQETG